MTTGTADPNREGWQRHETETFAGQMGEVYERRTEVGIQIALATDDRHRNLSGIVHGGVVMTLFDRAMGINARAAIPGARFVMASINVNFLRQVRIGEFLVMQGRVRKTGQRMVFADAEAHVGDVLVATASGVLMRVDRQE
jgi:uncharacterized protein (TIGR00369 family)